MTARGKGVVGLSVLALVALALGALFCPWFKRDGAEVLPPKPAEVVTVNGAEVHFGYEPHPEETRRFVESLPTPTIRDADPNLFRADKVDTFLYRALYKAYRKTYGREWQPHRQEIGDCVSHAWGLAVDVANAVDFEIGKSGTFKEAATEPIYGGSRVEARGVSFGGWSDGSYGGAAAKWVSKQQQIGGVVFRELVGGHDLTRYSGSLAKNWGAYGCGGKDDNGKLDLIARQHPVVDVTLVRNFEEAAAAIQSGYPVAVCSGQGFSSTRDKDGFAAPRGNWAHAMCFIGVRYGNRPGLLCQNSWANWNSGPKWPDDQPEGSFWVDADVCTRMLRGGDSFAVSGVDGFKWRDLSHGDWVQIDKKRDRERRFGEAAYALAN